MSKLHFPKDFLWGAATSSHQVEGGTRNDWSAWEKENARRLAHEARDGFGSLPNWHDIEKQATNPENYISGAACDHYRRYEQDFDIAKSLGHNAHRFSIEWSRVEPIEGKFDEKEIEHYRQVIEALHTRGIEPFVTLWHWTLPLWLSEKGGVNHREFPKYFERYAKNVVKALGQDVKFWITLNEPDVVTSHAYMKGIWPPQKKSFFLFLKTLYILKLAHKRAYAVIKKNAPEAEVGIAKHQVSFEMAHPTFINRFLKYSADWFWNRHFLSLIKHHQDFIGLNHYNRNVIDNGFYKNPNERLTDFGWEFFPSSLYQALLELKPYSKPIYITENGIADASDSLREEFIRETLIALHQAITEGVDARGYLYWSLLDNFEWDKGFWPRFGLVAVDYKTLERTIRPSALAYARICQENALETENKEKTPE
jgi:beta-glucosidase